MKTTKPISTISYNTIEFLQGMLDTFIKNHVIEFYCFIQHFPDTDSTKEHIHVYIEPNRSIDTGEFRSAFNQIVQGEELPRGVLPFQKTKDFQDWYLYGLHDTTYLAKKGQQRNIQYLESEMVPSNKDYLEYLISQFDNGVYMIYKQMSILASRGFNANDIIENLGMPLQYINYVSKYVENFNKNQIKEMEINEHAVRYLDKKEEE